MTAPVLVAREDDLRTAAARLGQAARIGLDLESNGLFKYRATLCTMQLATATEIVIVDTLAPPLAALADVVGPGGPRKIVHDVSFDARILAEAGLALGNVFDTSIAARMLGRTATGLATLLGSELGIAVDKKLQHHDWTERPLLGAHLQYLADDVLHLEALADRLAGEIATRGEAVAHAIEEETKYRIAQAIAAAGTVDPRPPWIRLKGVDRAPKDDLPLLRRLAEIREERAKRLDVPPYKVIGPDVLFAIAKARPKSMADLDRIKGASGGRARSIAREMLQAVAGDLGPIPEEERAMLERPRLPASVIKARREREARLTAWRKAEAKTRELDEQVVLPGHCLQDLADLPADATLDTVAAVPGIGAFRVERDGPALLRVLRAEEAAH